MKKLLLITPPYHAGVVEAAGKWPHLGFIYIAGHVRAAGYQVKIYDAMTKNHTLEQIREEIVCYQPDYVASTGYTSSVNAAIDVLRVAKEIKSSIVTLLGGIHANFCYDEILQKHPNTVDYVVRGEGEETVPELIRALESQGNLDEVQGIAFRQGDQVIVTPQRPFIHDLDSLIPAWDLVDWEDYTFHVMPGSRLGLVNSSRGCPHDCCFCSQQKFWFKTYRQRSAESFIEELEQLRDTYGVTIVMLSDEYPTRDRERWEKILDLMIEREVKVDLLLETCVPDVLRDADIMWKYRKAGVLHIYVGVEATNQETLDLFKKNIEVQQSKEAIRLINEAGMLTECSFVLGLPHETPESIRRTLELAKHYDPDFAHFLMIAPWPYADIYPDLKDHIVDWDYSKYNFVEPIVKPITMTKEEIGQAVVDCYREYYMSRVKEYPNIKDEFKRDYLIRSMKMMMENSFLARFIKGLGEIPDEIKKQMADLE
ncbi:MAG: cobalamin-dependent protein [Clostridia bacterium]|nr:cobalamin-dependent protein [Clostridia bacterium]